MEKVITERDVISKLRKEFRMVERMVKDKEHTLGRRAPIRQTAYPYVLCDEMANHLISANLSSEELAILYDVPCLYEKISTYFLQHLEERYRPYALCLREILAAGQAEPYN